MSKNSKIQELYKFDLQLHSSISPIKDCISLEFEKEMEAKVVEFLKENVRFKGDRKILFSGFIDRNFNAVLVEELCADMLLVTSLDIENMTVSSNHIKRNDCEKPFIKYTSVELTNVPSWLRLILKSRLSEEEQGYFIISTHRFIGALKYNLNNLVIHHTKYILSDREDDTRKIPDDCIKNLLPVTKDFHERILHKNYFDVFVDDDCKTIELKGEKLLETIKNYVEPKLTWNSPTSDQVKKVLTEHCKNERSINELSLDDTLPSRGTIAKIIEKYKNLSNFI